jgi:type IV secretory pathway TraG/TraD family ATPase VirD4
MPTQAEVINYIKSNYKYEEVSNGSFKMIYDIGNGRSQVVWARVQEKFLQVSSPYAHADKLTANRALQANETVFGTQQLGDFFVLAHVAFLEDIDPSEIDKGFGIVAIMADGLEEKLGKIDNL